MKQAIILAAGEGQRLRPFTVNRPKAMLDIAGKPILRFVVEALAESGIREICLVVGYQKEHVYDYMGSGEAFGVNIEYVTQATQLGTAHALLQARDVAADEFLVLPGDNLIAAATLADFVTAGPDAVLVKRVADPRRYGVVGVSGDEVSEIVEKPEEAGGNLVNTGIYAFNKDIFTFIGDVLDIPDALNAMIGGGRVIKAIETEATWLDAVYPWDIISLNSAVLGTIAARQGGTIESGVTIKGQVAIGEGTVIRPGTCIYGPAVIGAGCDIGPSVCILPATSIGDNVCIASFTEVRNSVIGGDVTIGPGGIIADSVIARGGRIEGRFTAASGRSEVLINGEGPSGNVGAIIGEDVSIQSGVSVRPGAIIGNGCQIQMSRVISGRLPDRSLVY